MSEEKTKIFDEQEGYVFVGQKFCQDCGKKMALEKKINEDPQDTNVQTEYCQWHKKKSLF